MAPLAYLLTVLHCLCAVTASNIFFSLAEVDRPCNNSGGAPGIRISTSSCARSGGTTISGARPGAPNDIKCCTKAACGSDELGNCRFSSPCTSGVLESGQCPGPSTFTCFMPPSPRFRVPRLPSLASGCKQTAIDGASAILNAFASVVKRVGCIGDDAHCNPPHESPSGHCGGLATHMFVAATNVSSCQ